MQNLEEDRSPLSVVRTLQSQGHVAMSQVKKILDWELGDQTTNKEKSGSLLLEQMVLPQILAMIGKVLLEQHGLGW